MRRLTRFLDKLTFRLLGVRLEPPPPVIAPLIEPAGIADLELTFRRGQALALVRRRWMDEATSPAGSRAVMDLCIDVQQILDPARPTVAELREPRLRQATP